MKEEVTGLLRGDEVEGAPPQTPMRGFVRSLAHYMLQVSIEEEASELPKSSTATSRPGASET